MGELLQSYWQPLYVFASRSGLSHEDAADAVQSFWEKVLQRGSLETADPARGKLRNFLLGAMQNHLRADYRKRCADKRGGGAAAVSFEAMEVLQAGMTPLHGSPTQEYEQRWAYALLDNARKRLQKEYEKRQRGLLFTTLESALAWNGGEVCYQALAQTLEMSEAAVQQSVRRMRLRYKKLLEEEILTTLDDGSQLEEEKEHLIRVLSSA